MELFEGGLNGSNRELFVQLDNEDNFILVFSDSLLLNASTNSTYNDTVDNSTLVIVDDSGASYPSGYSLAHIVLASVVVTLLMIVVVVGNMLVIIAIATEKALKNIQNWFIASLAVADFFLGLIIMPFSLANELMGYWIFGNWWCDIHSAMDVLLSTASIMNLCLISLDRYWSITQAVDYLKKRTPLRAAIMIFLVWLLSALICIPPLLGWKVERVADSKCEVNSEIGYVLYSALGSFYIPSCIMVFVYIRIYFAAKARARRGIRKRENKRQVEKEKCTSFTTVAKMMPMSHIHSMIGQGGPGGLMIPGAEQGYKTTPPKPEEDDEIAPVAGASGLSQQHQHVATVESVARAEEAGEEKIASAMISIPIVTCDFASDVSLSDADPSMQENGGAVYLEAPRPQGVSTGKHPLANPFSQSTLSINGDLQRGPISEAMEMSSSSSSGRCANAVSAGIENDMVSEFDPSSSDSGVVSRCAVVKPLKMRLCQPIFGRKAAGASSRGHNSGASSGHSSKSSRAAKAKKEAAEAAAAKVIENHHPPKPRDPEREKRRIARKKEKRATLILGLIMGSFIACWLPFFFIYILTPLCPNCIPERAFAIAFWLGYMNSALNPVIYTIFNKDFRRAFRRILFK